MNISSIALGGYQLAGKQLESVAGKIARLPLVAAASGEDSVDLSAAVVGLMTAQRAAEANLVVLRTAAELSRHTLDVLG